MVGDCFAEVAPCCSTQPTLSLRRKGDVCLWLAAQSSISHNSGLRMDLLLQTLAKNCGSGNDQDEPRLGHHPEAGQWRTGSGGALLLPYTPAGVMSSDDDGDECFRLTACRSSTPPSPQRSRCKAWLQGAEMTEKLLSWVGLGCFWDLERTADFVQESRLQIWTACWERLKHRRRLHVQSGTDFVQASRLHIKTACQERLKHRRRRLYVQSGADFVQTSRLQTKTACRERLKHRRRRLYVQSGASKPQVSLLVSVQLMLVSVQLMSSWSPMDKKERGDNSNCLHFHFNADFHWQSSERHIPLPSLISINPDWQIIIVAGWQQYKWDFVDNG